VGFLPQTYSWDGKNEQGTIMPPGWYTVRLTLKDPVGRVTCATKLVQLGEFAGAFNALAAASRGPENPNARGRWAVWQDQSSGNPQIYVQDLLTPGFAPIRLPASSRSQEKPRTDGRYVVWQSRQVNGGWDIWMADLLSGAQPWAMTSTVDVDETNPSVDWPWVVYESKPTLDAKAPKQLKAVNLVTGITQSVSESAQDELDPDVQAGRVVWQDNRDVGSGEIYFKNLESGELRRLTTNAFGQYHPAIHGNWVVWQDNRNGQVDLYAFDFLRDTEVRITQTTENETRPSIDGPWCVCEEDSLGADVANIRLIHLPTRQITPITRTLTAKSRPALAASHVVWQDGAGGQNTIMSAELPSLQPVFQNQNIVAVTDALAVNQHDARTLLARWNAQAGITEITRFASLTPTVTFDTARWINGQFSGTNFPLAAGSFLWVKFDTSQVIDLGVNGRGFATLGAGVNAISYTAFPNDYTAYKMARQLGMDKVKAVRILDAESGRWLVAEVRNSRLIGSDFPIPRAAVVFVDMDSPVAQWRPEP
jgi:beta propeller repeat protein